MFLGRIERDDWFFKESMVLLSRIQDKFISAGKGKPNNRET